MLQALKEDGLHELHCNSNVERILSKIPKHRQERFRRLYSRRHPNQHGMSLVDLSTFLGEEVRGLNLEPTLQESTHRDKDKRDKGQKGQGRSATVMHGTDASKQAKPKAAPTGEASTQRRDKVKVHCPYCEEEHWLNQCESFRKMSKREAVEWIKANRRCWRCARPHKAAECTLKKKCSHCQSTHLDVLHEVNHRDKAEPAHTADDQSVGVNYLDPAKSGSTRVMLESRDRKRD